MNICLTDFSGKKQCVSLSTSSPGADNIDDEILLVEDYQYTLSVDLSEEDIEVDDFILRVGDFEVKTRFDEKKQTYVSDCDRHFNDCFDLVSLSICIVLADQTEKFFYSKYLRIAIKKNTIESVSRMLQVIEDKIPNLLNAKASTNKKELGINTLMNLSIWEFLALVEELEVLFEGVFSYFLHQKKSAIEYTPSIVNARLMRYIDLDGLRWVAQNPDNLMRCVNKKGIDINGDFYLPLKVQTNLPQHSYNVYENRVILTFLRHVKEQLKQLYEEYSDKLKDIPQIPEKIVVQLPNTYGLTSKVIAIFYKSILKKVDIAYERIFALYNKYVNALLCTELPASGIPLLTNTFKHVYQYRICYDFIDKWFKVGGYSLQHLNYIFRFKTLSRIFEYYCLIQLQDAFIDLKFRFMNSSRVIYDDFDELVETIHNKYIFEYAQLKLTLLYEPIIWTNKLNGETNLYSTGYNFYKCCYNDYWKPDFVLKIELDNQEYYYILDAKYSKKKNVKKYYMPDLVLKYSTQIASYNKLHSDIVGVGAIYPNDASTFEYLKKLNLLSVFCEPIPKYFLMGIDYHSNAFKNLANQVKRLLLSINSLKAEL